MNRQWAGRLIGMGMLLAGPLAMADTFQGLQVEVIGQGRQVLMVPGLNSGIDSWRDTCLALQDAQVQCHLVQLPGFAGQPAQAEVQAGFSATIEQRLAAYIDQRMAPAPVLAGHSLGGFFALKLAAARPHKVAAVIVVDSLPFFPLAGDPAATEQGMRPLADAMRQQMRSLDEASYRQQAVASLSGMSKLDQRQALLQQWSADSDRETTAQAMPAGEERLCPESRVFLREGERCCFVEVRHVALGIGEGYELRLADGSVVEVSRRQARELRERMAL